VCWHGTAAAPLPVLGPRAALRCELLRKLERQAASAGRDIYIRPLLLDITHK
jgi:hypothetical protein